VSDSPIDHGWAEHRRERETAVRPAADAEPADTDELQRSIHDMVTRLSVAGFELSAATGMVGPAARSKITNAVAEIDAVIRILRLHALDLMERSIGSAGDQSDGSTEK